MIPKVELHVHLEGTTPPHLVRTLARRNGVTLPANLFHDDGAFHWRDFGHFLEVYDAASSVIKTPQDYRDVTYGYLASCAAEGAVYVEVMSSPNHAAAAGMSYRDHLDGIVAGISDAAADHGIVGRLIVTCVRHFGTEQAMKVARQVAAHPHPFVVGFGMGGDEANWPPGQFADAFNYVAASGLACTVHAGEWSGPAGIREAIATLPVARLGHGVRAIEDPGLIEEIVARGIALEVCPGSNVATGLYPSLAEHPLRRLIDAGVSVSINSDDPPYFATSIGHEYDNAASAIGLSSTALRRISQAAMTASFADPETKARLLAAIARD